LREVSVPLAHAIGAATASQAIFLASRADPLGESGRDALERIEVASFQILPASR
jgi:hypothetical protein